VEIKRLQAKYLRETGRVPGQVIDKRQIKER